LAQLDEVAAVEANAFDRDLSFGQMVSRDAGGCFDAFDAVVGIDEQDGVLAVDLGEIP